MNTISTRCREKEEKMQMHPFRMIISDGLNTAPRAGVCGL